MNCLIVSPPSSYQAMVMPRLALLSLAAELQKKHTVRYVDLKENKKDERKVFAKGMEGWPDVILTQSQFTNNAPRVYKLLRALKNSFPDTPIIVGGANASGDAAGLIPAGADFVVRGEAELVGTRLVSWLETGPAYPSCPVPGVTFLKNGGLANNGPTDLIQDLDTLPFPDWGMVKLPAWRKTWFGRMSLLETSRGCTYKCSFCSPTILYNNTWRGKSAERVGEEFERVQKAGAEFVWVCEIHTINEPEHVRSFCEQLIRQKNRVTWYSQMRADALVGNPDLLPLMYRAGARSFIVGMESGHDKALDALNKESSAEYNSQVITLLKANRIVLNGAFIVGVPGETKEEIRATIRMARRVDMPDFADLRPYPGTELAKNYNMAGRYHFFNQGYCMLHEDPAMANRMHKLAVFLTWLHPKRVLSALFHPNKIHRGLIRWRYAVAYDVVFRKRIKHIVSEKFLKPFFGKEIDVT